MKTSEAAAKAVPRIGWHQIGAAQDEQIHDRDRPTDLCQANRCRQMPNLFTVAEVAACLQVSPRWLADQCRAGTIEHVYVARQRRFTLEQVTALLTKFTHRPAADIARDDFRAKVMRRLARSRPT